MSSRTLLKEVKTETILPHKIIITGIYREKGKLVVRKFELRGLIRIPLDEEYVLNEEDAAITMNIMFHRTHKFTLN